MPTPSQPRLTDKTTSQKDARRERLARALKANLKRRKAAAKAGS